MSYQGPRFIKLTGLKTWNRGIEIRVNPAMISAILPQQETVNGTHLWIESDVVEVKESYEEILSLIAALENRVSYYPRLNGPEL